jgi:hypothetical protein
MLPSILMPRFLAIFYLLYNVNGGASSDGMNEMKTIKQEMKDSFKSDLGNCLLWLDQDLQKEAKNALFLKIQRAHQLVFGPQGANHRTRRERWDVTEI